MWEYFQAGGPLMWPLLACSLTAFAVVLERCWFWSRLKLKQDSEAALEMLAEVKEGNISTHQNAGILCAMLRAGLMTPPTESVKAMELIALEVLSRMRKGMNCLDTIITAAPMLGIMGTVLGIISSFDMLGHAGVSEPKAVISGIAQALITTASGLGIAVFTIFPFNYFNARIDAAQDLIENYSTRLEIIMSLKKENAEEKNASSENA